jgi:hypothetical protein
MRDWYEHEFNPIQHEIQVHMVYGNQHVDKDLLESNSDNNKNKKESSTKSGEQTSIHILADEYKNYHYPALSKKQFILLNSNKSLSASITSEGPPPKSVLKS